MYNSTIPNNIKIRDVNLNNRNELETIGALIYYVDPWVYPDFFDSSIEIAKKVAPYLLKRDTVYNYKYIKLITVDDEVAGFYVALDEYPQNNYDETKKAFLEAIGYLPKNFEKVMEGYFNTLSSGWIGRQILSLSILPEFRRRHLAQMMLSSLDEHITYSLACVKDNLSARELYKKAGFVFLLEYPGYTGIPCVELIKEGK